MTSALPAAASVSWRALMVPTNPTEFWTLALTAATVALVAVAYFGLRSVALSKKDMLNRATRETVQCAIDHCDAMARELLPLYMVILGEFAARSIPLFVSDPGQVSFEEREEIAKINAAIGWMGKLDSALIAEIVDLTNRLECWSMSFTHDPSLADEKVAFDPCSTVFCQMVMSLYPSLLTQRRANPASGPYQNVVTLFNGWYAKKEQGQMLEKLARLQSDGSKLPPPLGASLD